MVSWSPEESASLLTMPVLAAELCISEVVVACTPLKEVVRRVKFIVRTRNRTWGVYGMYDGDAV